ncbi:dienelactone hydrolase family protein [Rhodococcus sp. O3]|uniref:dienelactone hydrolase family protein n=1 Tax=Rhodococcus sp. O3 TaxID=3404919 RepID=UPI003B67D633
MQVISTVSASLPGDAGQVPLTVIRPDGTARGAIVLLHESRVFSPALLQFMDALAGERWLVVAPHLFHREPAHSAVEVFGDALFADVDAAFEWIGGRGVSTDMIGLIGFDDAGVAALVVATQRRVGAVVSVAAGGITTPVHPDAPALLSIVGSLQAPWLGLYGEDDPGTPPADVERLQDAAAGADAPTLVVGYPGLAHRPDEPPVEHATVDPETDPQEAAIVDARRRIFDWFDAHMR